MSAKVPMESRKRLFISIYESAVRTRLFSFTSVCCVRPQCEPTGYITQQLSYKYDKTLKKLLKADWEDAKTRMKNEVATYVMVQRLRQPRTQSFKKKLQMGSLLFSKVVLFFATLPLHVDIHLLTWAGCRCSCATTASGSMA